MNHVFVLDSERTPLAPCMPRQARLLLQKKKASVLRYFPFTLILHRKVENPVTPRLRLKIDPGSKVTGLAILNEDTGEVVWAAELEHRGSWISKLLLSRRGVRRSRRDRKTRYRQPRFLNRTRKEGWLPPSLESRITNVETWVKRLWRVCPLTGLSMELVKFDTQQMQNPEISGVEYQQGELAGYEIREYLLEKWGRQCAYCGKKDVPLQVEHIHSKAKGGSNRVSNLCLSCEPCNTKKGTQPVEQFLAKKPEILKKILAQAKAPLKDAAAVNTTRWVLYKRLNSLGLPLETGTGGRTKYNRTKRGLPKTHWIDAACVGSSTPEVVKVEGVQPLKIKAMGHGCRQHCGVNASGFPISHSPRKKHFMGFQTGDTARATIPSGKYKGKYVGRIAIRFTPQFRLNGIDVHPKYLVKVQRAEGYSYAIQ